MDAMGLEDACEKGAEFTREDRVSLGEDAPLPAPEITKAWEPDDCACVYSMQAVQAMCLAVILAYHTALGMSDGDGNNVSGLVQAMESMTLDSTTVLFVVTGCLDSYLHRSTEITRTHFVHNCYNVNCLLYPHLVITLVPFLLVGLAVHGLWLSPMTWVINLGTALYLPPFLEYDQTSPFRLINQPVSILITFILCRCLHPLATLAIQSAVNIVPRHHEIVNLLNSMFQTTMSCIFTVLHLQDNHLYFSYRFLLPRFSEYTLGCVVYTYLISPTFCHTHGILDTIDRKIQGYEVFVFVAHFLIWASVVNAPNEKESLCSRITQNAPCMDLLDAVVSRGVLLSMVILGLCKRSRRMESCMTWLCDHMTTIQLQMVYQYPITLGLSLLMAVLHLQRFATVFWILSLIFGLVLAHNMNRVLTPRNTLNLDLFLSLVEDRLTNRIKS